MNFHANLPQGQAVNMANQQFPLQHTVTDGGHQGEIHISAGNRKVFYSSGVKLLLPVFKLFRILIMHHLDFVACTKHCRKSPILPQLSMVIPVTPIARMRETYAPTLAAVTK